MIRIPRRMAALAAACALASLGLMAHNASAQFGPPPPPDTRNAHERAPIDITGQWVAVVTEDWRWRMVTPPVGDSASIPLNAKGRAATMAWDYERDRREGNLCRPYGPPGGIRQPTRLRIDWEDGDTLRLTFDAGNQTRRFHFKEGSYGAPSLQGYSVAKWFRQTQSRGVFAAQTPPTGGALHVKTTNLTAGYLRPNGVPYSERATVKEFFNTFTLPDGNGSWLVVTTVVNDPEYLSTELILSTQFKKETNRSKWNPRACEIAPPLVEPARQTR
jgi:hypothetical protein